MTTKKCGDCRNYVSGRHGGVCTLISCEMCSDDDVCNHFEKPTNGDKIRRMSNEELVSFKGARHCTFCAYCDQKTDKCNRPIGGTCAEGILEWLNAPADCVKQNSNHWTQADLRKADNTESEGEDD